MKTEFNKDNFERAIIDQALIPVGKKDFEYQCESTTPILKLEAYAHGGRGMLPYLNDEQDVVMKYELEIFMHTRSAVTVQLRKHYKYPAEPKTELFQLGFSFSEFVNKIFSNTKCSIYENQ